MTEKIELNGHRYLEAERGRFEAALVDAITGEEIAHTEGEAVIFYGGAPLEDVQLWAGLYDIAIIEER